MVIVDDALLLGVIAGRREPPIQALVAGVLAGEVFTTGSWYWRLARVVGAPTQGALSRQLAALREDQRLRVRSGLAKLPAEIGILGPRRLVPIMAVLGGQLNFLTAEAVAAAVVLEAEILVTTNSPLLAQAANSAGIAVRVVSFAG